MPSPFPGMDPYLESPLHWRDVHHRLAAEISRRLSPRLSPRYVARLETRLVALSPDEEEISLLVPDVEVTQTQLRELAIATYEVDTDVADAIPPPPLVLRAITPEQIELITVEIRDSDYLIFLTRAERRNVTETWPVGVRDPLPVVPVPLLPGDDDVPLDLGHTLRTIYDEARYDLSIDYGEMPIPPLPGNDAA